MESSSFRFSSLCFFFIIAAIAGYSDVVVGECLYTIAVQTGSKSGAGTDSVITLTLGDDNGATLRLNNIAQYGLNGPSYDYFEKGQLDHFSYKDNKAACLDVCNIIVTSDNSGYKPGWYLSSVEVTAGGPNQVEPEPYSTTIVKFEINQWIALSEPPHSLSAVKNKCPLDEAKGAGSAFNIVHALE